MADRARLGAPARAIRWVALPLLLLVGAATVGCSESSSEPEMSSTTVQEVTLDDAVGIARRTIVGNPSDRLIGNLVVDLCDAADVGVSETFAAELAGLPLSDTDDLQRSISAVGRGAEAYCPDQVDKAPTLLSDAYREAAPMVATTTTAMPSTSASDSPTAPAPTTTARSTAPTAKPTATTKAVSTTKAPAPTAPPATTAPPTSQGTSNNSGAVHPGSFCSPEGATGYSSTGVPMTCSPASCTNEPYGQPRWRKTTC